MRILFHTLNLIAASSLCAACSSPLASGAAPERPAAVESARATADGVVHLTEASRKFVSVETVADSDTTAAVAAPARVDFRDGAVSQVGAPLAGRIVKVHVQVGDRVREGDPLVTLDAPDAASTRASVQSSAATLREAHAALDRQVRMLAQGVGTERDRLAAETRVSELDAELARLQANIAFIGAGTGTTVVVRSPTAGTIISRRATAGMAVQPGGDSLVEVGDASAVWIVANVFERDLHRVRAAGRVRVQLESLSGELDGHVASIGSIVATGLRTAPVWIVIEGHPAAILRPGMFGRVQIEAASNGITLPTDAVLIRDGKESVVYVEKDASTFVRREVVVAQHADNGRVQVLSGLSAGEKVVVRGALLIDGSADLLL